MSEYQYYEFQAIDRVLTNEEIKKLRSYSTRAEITKKSFINVYHWGDFKGDPKRWMEEYFDAFLYVTNWGTNELSFRIPNKFITSNKVAPYEAESELGGLSFRIKDDFLILDFASYDDEGGWEDEDEELLGSLLPIREELMMGDYRSLYLAWLVCAQNGMLEGRTLEPPVPAGLGQLSDALLQFVDYLRLDTDLIEIAAQDSSPEVEGVLNDNDYKLWLDQTSEEQKDLWLIDLLTGKNPQLQICLRKTFDNQRLGELHSNNNSAKKRRTVSTLLKDAKNLSKLKQKKAAEEKAQARAKYLKELALEKTSNWAKLDDLSAQKRPDYGKITQLLKDLKEACAISDQANDFNERLLELRTRYQKRATLMRELRQMGLG